MQTFIINPDTKQPVTIDDWRKDQNPTKANLVLLDLDGYKLLMAKNHSEERYWQDANNYAAEFTADGFSGFRLRTRKENIDICDCRFLGQLDEALKLIGGNANRGWSWGRERSTDPAYSDQCAWSFYGGSGGAGYANGISFFYSSRFAVPVALYPSTMNPEAITRETPLVQMTAGQLADFLKTQAPTPCGNNQ